jgi:hypothetical protein
VAVLICHRTKRGRSMKKLLVLAIAASFAVTVAGCTTMGKAPIGKTPVVTKY